jgi:hypothetical protein
LVCTPMAAFVYTSMMYLCADLPCPCCCCCLSVWFLCRYAPRGRGRGRGYAPY